MKKLMTLLLAMTMLLTLAACGAKEEPAPAPEEKPAVEVDLNAFYEELYAELYPQDSNGDPTGPAVMDMGLEAEMAEGFYPGLAELSEQLHIFMPMMTGVPYELVLVKVADAANVETVKGILQSRVDLEAENQMNYPMVQENWELNSKIVDNGNYVMLVVSSDYEAYVEAFNALFA